MALNKEIIISFYLVLGCFKMFTDAYKPVVLVHGILSSGPSMIPVETEIKMVRLC
jgi:hypothetical protein